MLPSEADPDVVLEISWRVFSPSRPDARLVGLCGEQLASILLPKAGVREVYVVEGTVRHYMERHLGHFDIARAESLMATVLADPLMVYEEHSKQIIFFGEYSERHYLLLPVKTLPGELWVSSVFIDRKTKAERKWERRGTLLYKKGG